MNSDERAPVAAKYANAISREDYMESKRRKYPKRKRSKAPVIILVIILLVLLTAGAVVGFYGYKLYNSAKQVRSEAKWMMTQVDPLKKAIKTGDEELLDETVMGLMEKAAWIQAETHSDLWEFATNIPVYGEDIRTAQALSDVAVTLTRDVLYPLSEDIGGIKLSSLIQDGGINIELLRFIPEVITKYIPLIDEQFAIIEELPPAHIDKLQEVLDKLQNPLAEYRPLIKLAEDYLPMLPPMLGADGETRTYLVIAMNNAEIRSDGGYPGATGTLTVTDGHFSMGEFESIVHNHGLHAELLPGEEVYNFGITYTYSAVTAMPNFNRTGELAADFWRQVTDEEVDGVIAIDPVALQYFIGYTGGFDTSDGTHIDGTNAAYEIMHNIYVRYWDSNWAHDLFFAEVASNAFSTFFSNLGDADLDGFAKTVMRLGEEGRILTWMVNPDEQAMFSEFGFTGEFSHDPLKPVLGIYLNDETYSKIDWFLSVDVDVSKPAYNSDGTATYDVTFVLSNNITYDFAVNNTVYIRGDNESKRDATDMLTTIFFSMPQDAVLESFSSDPERDHWDGWPEGIQVIKCVSSDLGGTSSTFHLRVTVPAGAEPLKVHVTPLAQEENLNIVYEYQKDSVV